MNVVTRFVVALLCLLTATIAQAQSDYRIRVGDFLRIEVVEDDALNRQVEVLPGGRITFPFAGPVTAAGRTASQVERSIANAISDQFASPPTVFVSVRRGPEDELPLEEAEETIDIYFVGEVNTPGLREVRPGTTFLQAIGQSGGLTRFAATKRLQLRRTERNGATTTVTVNYKALADGAALREDIVLHDGDVILVPERRLFE